LLRVYPRGSPTFKSRSRGYPDLARSLGKSLATIGLTASGLGTGNTTFASAWPTRRPLAKSEKDWNIGFAKCITSVSGAEVAENHDSWINSAEVPILSHQYRSREPSLAAARALGRPPSPVRDRTPRPRSPNAPASASNQPPTRQISPIQVCCEPIFHAGRSATVVADGQISAVRGLGRHSDAVRALPAFRGFCRLSFGGRVPDHSK
jgi:hypothetical protein